MPDFSYFVDPPSEEQTVTATGMAAAAGQVAEVVAQRYEGGSGTFRVWVGRSFEFTVATTVTRDVQPADPA
jgi:hypothetical protein